MNELVLKIGIVFAFLFAAAFVWRLVFFVYYLYFYTPCNRRGCICKKQGQPLFGDRCRIYGAAFKNPEEH